MNLPNQTELRRIARMLDANFLVSENNLLNTVMEEEEKRNKEATRIYPDSMGVRSIAVQPLIWKNLRQEKEWQICMVRYATC